MQNKATVKRKLKKIIPEKWKLTAILSLSFSLSFLFFLQAPSDIFLHNPLAFVLNWKLLLPPMLIVSAISFFSLSLFLILLSHKNTALSVAVFLICSIFIGFARFALIQFTEIYIYLLAAVFILMTIWILLKRVLKEKAIDVLLLLVFGLILAAYVQTLFLNREMRAITGAQPDYRALMLTNLLIWILIILLPLGLWILLMAKKKDFRYEKILILSLLIITGMQVTGLVSTAASTELPKGYAGEYKEDKQRYSSYEAILSLSAEDNVIVFILDRMDVLFTREVLEKYPYVSGYLDGFTHYENNISEFFDTAPSTTSMLTQHYYREGQTLIDYQNEAWAQHNMIDTLKENGFTINLYIDYVTTYNNFDNIESRADNVRLVHGVQLEVKHFIITTIRLSFGRLLPYICKSYILNPLTPSFGNYLFSYTELDVDPLAIQPLICGHSADMHFMGYIEQNKLSADNKQKVFTVMHMGGAHGPPELNIPHLLFSLDLVNIYMEKMKEIGVFDNSTIIMLGDHGTQPEESEVIGWSIPVTTSLLIKPKGSTGELIIDSISELSHKYFAASVLEFAGLPHEELGLSYYDITGGATPPKRIKYDLGSWWLAWLEERDSMKMVVNGYYEVSGDALDGTNWVFFENTG